MDCIIIGDVFFDLMIRRDPSKLCLVRGGTSYCNQVTIEAGGMGNVAVGLSRLGGEVQFIGKAGCDMLGSFYEDDLMEEGVKAKLLFDQFHPTGLLTSFVDKRGERSFLVSRGANDFLLPEEVERYESDIKKTKYLFISGYSLVNYPQTAAILKAVEIAKSNKVKVIFDLGAHNLVRQKRKVFEKLTGLSDVITANVEEAGALTNCDRIQDIAKNLSRKVPLTALKMGKRGCMIISSKKIVKCKSTAVDCVDSSGAGDSFDSALIYSLIKHFSLELAAKLANWYASCTIQKLGPRGFPSKDEISNYLRVVATS